MSSFLYGLGRWAFRRRVAILLTWLTVLVVLGGLAAVGGKNFDESFSLPGTESQTALDSLSRTFPQASGTTAQVVVVAPPGVGVRDRKVRAAIEQAAAGYARIDQIDQAISPFDEYARGVISDDGQAADGPGQLADGLAKLSTGSKSLADGTQEFADGIAKGRREVPTYTESQRDRLSAVVSAPVTVPASDGASYSDIATTTLLVVLALWLGGLAAFVVLRPVTDRVLASKPSWRLAFEALGPAAVIGAVQAVVLSVVLQRLLDLSAGQTAALVPLAVLTAVTFAAVNQALVAALGGLGRFLSVLAAVVVTAGALTTTAPALFATIAPYLPLTPPLQGLRAVVTGGSGGPAAVGQLLSWLLLSVSISVLAVARRRMLPATASPIVAELSGAA